MYTETRKTRYVKGGEQHATVITLTHEPLLSAREKNNFGAYVVDLQVKWRKHGIPESVTYATLEDMYNASAEKVQVTGISYAKALEVILASPDSSCDALVAIYERYPEHAPIIDSNEDAE